MKNFVCYYSEGHQAHQEAGHPERPERLEAIRAALEEAGYWKEWRFLQPATLPAAILEAVHSRAYLNLLEIACRRGGRLDVDTYVTPASWQLAQQAAGGAAAVAQAVWLGEARRGLALVRPPGHHATPSQGMGFCLLNNIALAAEALIKQEKAKRLAIVDLDLHHGNGTQEVFWKRSDVFYISTHQMPLYPGTGRLEERGAGEGEGFTANFPMPPGSGDQAFQTVMAELILPLLDRYQPEMVLVSYGFDTHWNDPLGSLLLSVDGYARLIKSLADWSDRHCWGRIALVLEGGYDLEAASACTLAVAAALLGQPWQDPLGPAPYREGEAWKGMLARAKALWQLD